jgi:alanyl-tRNA synthetase
MDAIGGVTGKKYGGRLDDLTNVAFRVIADHLRMLTFAITDGALPSNKGRGSVMRSVLRRAVRFGWQCFEQRQPFIYSLVPALVEHMGNAYPELKKDPKRVAEVIRGEEADFLRTIERGLSLFEKAAQRAKQTGTISGQDVFDLYTTYGFPPDLTRQMANERGLTIEEESYESLMEEHRSVSASDSMKGLDAATIAVADVVTDDRPKWVTSETEAAYSGEVPLGPDNVGVMLDRTCFYAEAGGQVGDEGVIRSTTAEFQVRDTVKRGSLILHVGRYTKGRFAPDESVHLQVSSEREFTRKNHTATHLLHWALQRVLGEHVEQRGSKVKPDAFTFDFSHTGPMSESERAEVERLVNEKIYEDLPVQWRELPVGEAKRLPGVRAFFGDKYGEVVRVVEIGDGFSREFCGGTHLAHTGQAGFFKIISEEAVGKGVRRLTCVTAREAVATVQKHEAILAQLNDRFRCKPEDLPSRVEALQEEIKKLQQQLKKGATADLQGIADKLLTDAEEVRGVKIVVGQMPAGPDESMRQQVDRLRQKAGSAVVVIGWSEDSRVQLIAAVTEDLVKKGGHAGKLVGQVAKVVGGGGGGKPTMAQAGGKDPAKLPEALRLAKELATQMVK